MLLIIEADFMRLYILFQEELAQICCECEKYIGTQGGGMDQAISLLAEEGKVTPIYLLL